MTTPAAASVSATFTPAAAAYSANDVMDVAKEFAGIAHLIGGIIKITRTELQIAHTAIISGETSYDLHLYSVTPPSAHADNAPWDLPAGDRASYLGKIHLGAPIDVGSTLRIAQDGLAVQINVPASVNGGSLFGELVTVGGFTATAAARKVTLHAEWL